jgi:hypothetical protein
LAIVTDLIVTGRYAHALVALDELEKFYTAVTAMQRARVEAIEAGLRACSVALIFLTCFFMADSPWLLGTASGARDS